MQTILAQGQVELVLIDQTPAIIEGATGVGIAALALFVGLLVFRTLKRFMQAGGVGGESSGLLPGENLSGGGFEEYNATEVTWFDSKGNSYFGQKWRHNVARDSALLATGGKTYGEHLGTYEAKYAETFAATASYDSEEAWVYSDAETQADINKDNW